MCCRPSPPTLNCNDQPDVDRCRTTGIPPQGVGTGGAGFNSGAVVRQLRERDAIVFNLEMGYASDLA